MTAAAVEAFADILAASSGTIAECTWIRVKIKGVLQGVMASDSEPGKFFLFDPQTPPGIKISTPPQLTPLENIQKRSK